MSDDIKPAGPATFPFSNPADLARFLSKFKRGATDECWPWQCTMTDSGYGQFLLCGKFLRAHRLSYELATGRKIVNVIDHLCRNPRCVNPAHLEDVTVRENTLRGQGSSAVRARQTHCIRGHEFDSTNTRITPQGYRRCRECERQYERLHWSKRRLRQNERRKAARLSRVTIAPIRMADDQPVETAIGRWEPGR